MTEDNETKESGIESLDRDINMLESKMHLLTEVRALLTDLKTKADVTVRNPVDSRNMEIRVESVDPYDEMVTLSKIDQRLQGEAISKDDIVYKPEEGKYKLSKKIIVR